MIIKGASFFPRSASGAATASATGASFDWLTGCNSWAQACGCEWSREGAPHSNGEELEYPD